MIQAREEEINKIIKDENLDTDLISDGYHTFGELYDHRIALFIALCDAIFSHARFYPMDIIPWKSIRHSDNTEWEGWFIAGIGREEGKQITYHLPIEKWEYLGAIALDKAPKWDGHTPKDVIERLLKLC